MDKNNKINNAGEDNKYKNSCKEEGSKSFICDGGSNMSSIKGGQYHMTTALSNDKLFASEVVGMRSLRSNLSEFISKSINNFQEVLTANTAVKGGKTVSIISTDMLRMMLDSCLKFNTKITFDDVTEQYVASVEELDADGQGKTKEEAICVLLDNIIALTEDYFENIELYLRIENSKIMLPYFERIRHCEDINEMIKVLGLDKI